MTRLQRQVQALANSVKVKPKVKSKPKIFFFGVEIVAYSEKQAQHFANEKIFAKDDVSVGVRNKVVIF